MANSANAVYVGSGPAFTNQVVALGGKDALELAYRGYATFTGDASTQSVTINFIDGTQTPFFTQANPPVAVAPTMVMATIGKGATSSVYSCGVVSISTTGFVVEFNATIPATSFTVDFIICP